MACCMRRATIIRTSDDAARMEALEIDLLARLRIPADPYARIGDGYDAN
jgi:hypothetical protein